MPCDFLRFSPESEPMLNGFDWSVILIFLFRFDLLLFKLVFGKYTDSSQELLYIIIYLSLLCFKHSFTQ